MRYYFLLTIAMGILLPSCHDYGAGPSAPNAMLTADVEVTDVLLTIHLVPGMQQQGTLTLTRNDSVIASFVSPLSDTTFLDSKLHPNTSYVYESRFVSNMFPFELSSGRLAIKTLDMTSHNFIWQMDTLGVAGLGILYDVAIINDTLAYAVGDLYEKDSLGNLEGQAYGVAIWNGKSWGVKRVFAQNQQGYDENIRPIRGICAFSDKDIWLADGNAFHWDGQSDRMTPYWISGYPGNPTPILGPDQGISKFWGTSSGSLYGVGVNGGTAHYDGSSWQKLESGTTLDIQDIWGAQNTQTGEWEILAVAGNYYESGARKILKITGTSVTALPDSGMNDAPNSVWFSPSKRYWIAGAGLWDKHFTLAKPTWTEDSVTIYSTNRIRGTDINNVFFCGSYGDMFHFNGSSWQGYRAQMHTPDALYISIAVKNDCIFAVGIDNPGAVIARGQRFPENGTPGIGEGGR